MATFFKNVVVVKKQEPFMLIMPQDREVDWRTCPTCGEEHPWRMDSPKVFVVCRVCAVKDAAKTAVALANAGHGTGFGNQGGKR